MDETEFSQVLASCDRKELYHALVDLNCKLTNSGSPQSTENDSLDYNQALRQLNQAIELFNVAPKTKKSKDEEPPKIQSSSNLFKLLSRNLVLVFHKLPTKIYDVANNFLNHLSLNSDNELSAMAQLGVIVLIDLYETFPNSLGSLINFSVNQIYKILKKSPNVSGNLVYLLNAMTMYSTRNDIDDKLQAKLVKIATKGIMSLPVKYDTDSDKSESTSILLKKSYLLVLRNLSILAVNANYEHLLSVSASSSSGAKMKPESIMSHQHQFQLTLLTSIEKPIMYALANYCKDIRIAAVETLGHLFINFVPTGKFNAVEYLVGLYQLPNVNIWNHNLTRVKIDEQFISPRKEHSVSDSEDSLASNTSQLCFNTGVIEALIFHIQLEQFQNSDYLSSQLSNILSCILEKFAIASDESHMQSSMWVKTLHQWQKLLEYLIKESGPNCHEILVTTLLSKFDTNSTADLEQQIPSSTKDKRASTLFSLKGSKTKSRVSGNISVYSNPYQCCLVLFGIEQLLPFGINFNSFLSSEDAKQEQTEEGEDVDESQRLEYSEKSLLVELLFKLVINKNDYIRNYATHMILRYAQINKIEVNNLALTCFKLYNSEWQNFSEGRQTEVLANLETNTSSLVQVRLVSYALVLLALLKNTELIHLQNATVVKILSFCTQTLKHTTTYSRANTLKSIVCWIILSSLVSLHNESEFVKLNSSQFLIFWKSLLTAQYVPTNLSGSELGEEKELLDNLKLRNISLVCLLNYIDTVDMTPESLKQIQFLLTKAYAYLTHLESIIESIGDVTEFNGKAFNSEDFNYGAIGNLLFSNHGYNDNVGLREGFITSILYGKKLILKNYSKLAAYLKNDINSSTVVLLVKVFSDPTIFSVENTSKQSKSKTAHSKLNDYDSSTIILNDDLTHDYGVTSKFTDFSSNIDELLPTHSLNPRSSQDNLRYKDPFEMSSSVKGVIENNSSKESETICYPWFDYFERIIVESSGHSINYDPITFIQGEYSYLHEFSALFFTSFVDISIELFQLVFPYLTVKIQLSLLEQIRSSLISKTVIPLRYKALCVNISVALHGVLSYSNSKKVHFEKEIVAVIIDILKKIDTASKNLIEINSDSIGMAASLLDKKSITDQIDSYVSSIVNNVDPLARGKALSALSKIYSYTGSGANDIFNVVTQLLNDPHPLIHYYSLVATSLLFDNNLSNHTWISPLTTRLFESYLDDSFGYDVKNKEFINLTYKYGTTDIVAKVLKIFITNLGPNLRLLPEENRQEMKSLIVSLHYAIGASSCDDNIKIFNQLLRLLQELIIFDPGLIPNEIEFYSNTLVSVISKNLKLGLSTTSPTSLNLEAIFPFNSSFELFKLGYACLTELIKVCGQEVLTKDVVQLIWISLNMKPCEELKHLIHLWMDSSIDMNWFATLNSLFKISSKKLTQPFVEQNYQQKLLPLLQRQKKKSDKTIDFKDEEIENIVGDDNEAVDKNEPVTWEFKLFIYDLLNSLMSLASRNLSVCDRLKPRINDLVKIAFLGSTSPINIIKLSGINLLDNVLGLFGDMEDSMYTGISILEQQQAQIISAIMPCFNSGSSAEVIAKAVNVSSKFINIPKIKFYSKQRIMKTLIYLLEELSSNKFLRFGFLENMSEYGKRSIQVSILNCWALVRLNAYEDMKNSVSRKVINNDSVDFEEEDTEPENELIDTLEKYSTLLIALWIVSLKEFSTLKFSDPNSKELEIYNNYWINFISVLSLELEENNSFVEKHLEGDASTFFFILFSQCVESLIKNKNVVEVLISLNSLVKNKELVDILFHDEIFEEMVDLFDRLILVDEEAEIQIKLVNIVNSLFQTYFESHAEIIEGFDKLFELIRLCMLPLFNILPFLRSDFDPNDKQTSSVLKQVDSGPNLVIMKNVIAQLVQMLPRFPDVVRSDLYSCLLFIVVKIYEFKNELLISTVLPYLKQIISASKLLNPEMVQTFNRLIQEYYPIRTSKSSVLTYMVLISSGGVDLNESDSAFMKDSLILMISNSDTKAMGMQCIKLLIQTSSTQKLLVVKLLIAEIVQKLAKDEINGKVAIEVLVLFVKSQSDQTIITKLYSVLIQLILGQKSKLNQYYLHEKLLLLIEFNSESFKTVINLGLSAEQRQQVEHLVKLSASHEEDETMDESEIQLKTFG